MNDATQSSFQVLAFKAALKNTRRTFESIIRDLIIVLASLLLGFLFYFYRYGLPTALDQIISVVVFSVAPMLFCFTIVFLWNLWLSPFELIFYQRNTTSPTIQQTPVDWNIWRERSRYSINEFSAILAKSDPISISSTKSQTAFRRLLIEQCGNKKITYVKRYSIYSPNTETRIDGDTEILKADAVSWAESKNYSIGHIQ